jgi:probable HAF family extracellular repeat protein
MHRTKVHFGLIAATWLVVGIASQPIVAAPRFIATPLGPNFGSSSQKVNGINSSGQVAGSIAVPPVSQLIRHAAVYANGTQTDLGALVNNGYSYASALNNRGQVVGFAYTASGERAFIYDDGVMTSLGTFGGEYSRAFGINDNGQVVGEAAAILPPSSPFSGSASHAFLYADGVMNDLGTLGGTTSIAYGVNSNGEVTGMASVPGPGTFSENVHAFFYTGGVMRDLGTLGGEASWGYAINDNGQITGYALTRDNAGSHAFLYSGGAMHDLGVLVLGGFSTGYAINVSGHVVGNSSAPDRQTHAFFYADGVMYDLNSLVVGAQNPVLQNAVAINNSDQIVANGCIDGACGVYLLDPVSGPLPPPTTTAVEYYYSAWNFYFLTAFPDEIAALDGGAFGGAWKRTGETFQVWPQSNAYSSPTCRFFTIAFAPKSSHFYTPFPQECAIVKTEPEWQFEGIAFHMELANANGLCGAGTIPLYRIYNNGMGGAPNHRYTTSQSVLFQMITSGWSFEGDAITRIFGCVPQ